MHFEVCTLCLQVYQTSQDIARTKLPLEKLNYAAYILPDSSYFQTQPYVNDSFQGVILSFIDGSLPNSRSARTLSVQYASSKLAEPGGVVPSAIGGRVPRQIAILSHAVTASFFLLQFDPPFRLRCCA